jgi:hypothetical protein
MALNRRVSSATDRLVAFARGPIGRQCRGRRECAQRSTCTSGKSFQDLTVKAPLLRMGFWIFAMSTGSPPACFQMFQELQCNGWCGGAKGSGHGVQP